MTRAAARLTRHRVVSGALVVLLAAINLTDHLLHPPWWVRAAGGRGPARLGAPRRPHLAAAGTGPRPAGLRVPVGLGAIGVVAGVYVVGVLLPLTRPAFQDVRYDLPLPEALRTAFVVIPFGTVALEEIAFRSVLWGMLSRHLRQWQVLVADVGAVRVLARHPGAARAAAPTAGCPTRSAVRGAVAVVAGTLALTTAWGPVFGELRRRSDSLLASVGAHWATNALGVLFGLVAWRLLRNP